MNPAPSRGGSIPGPNWIAAALSMLVVLAFLVRAIQPSAAAPGTSPSQSPAETTPPTLQPTHPVDTTAVEVCRAVDRRLAEAGLQLSDLTNASDLDVPAIQTVLRGMNPQLLLGIDAARQLQSRTLSATSGTQLGHLYEDLRATIEEALKASVRNDAAYLAASQAVLERLRDLPALDEAAAALQLATPPPSLGPTVGPRSSASSSPVATPSPSIPPSPSPSTVPTARPGANLLANGGFEDSVEPWRIETGNGGSAVAELDPALPESGLTSLRVTINAGSASWQGVSIRQPDVEILPLTRYRLTIHARAAGNRDLRLGVLSPSGAAYASTIGAIGSAWSTVTLEFVAIAGDERAVVAIDLGRDVTTTWLDDVVLYPVAP